MHLHFAPPEPCQATSEPRRHAGFAAASAADQHLCFASVQVFAKVDELNQMKQLVPEGDEIVRLIVMFPYKMMLASRSLSLTLF